MGHTMGNYVHFLLYQFIELSQFSEFSFVAVYLYDSKLYSRQDRNGK